MRDIKMVICQTEWPCDKTLKTYAKMTPGGKGRWKNLVGVPTIEEAELAVIIDYTIYDLPIDMPKVYIGAHPPPMSGYRCYDDKEAIAKFDLRDTAGFGEWWLDWNYDEVMNLKCPEKTKDISVILSNKRQLEEHTQRRVVVNKLCQDYPGIIDVYGRIIPDETEEALKKYHKGMLGECLSEMTNTGAHTSGKTPALLPYKYSLEFDYYCQCPHYFSERFYDALLMWCMPIYSGGKGIDKYLPRNSYIEIDSFKVTSEEIAKYIKSGFREEHIKDITEARDLLLNKYQLWPRVEEGIRGKL